MSQANWRRWLALALLGGCCWGCSTASGKHGFADDPLLVRKKPVEEKPENAVVELVARAEPTPPAMPGPALALASDSTDQLADSSAAERKPWVTATPVSRLRGATNDVVQIPVRRQVPGVYGHAADLGWIQGVLKIKGPREYYLRFGNEERPKQEFGNKVTIWLEKDDRLLPFRSGDIVLVEGERIEDTSLTTAGKLPDLPRYRINRIWLVQRD